MEEYPHGEIPTKKYLKFASLKAGEFFLYFFFIYSAVTRISFVPLIVMARNSWNLVLPSAIANCFIRAQFVKPSKMLKRSWRANHFII